MAKSAARAWSAGIYPFWFWNGDMTADEIGRQVSELKAQGIKGFFIHPRQGLQIPYLSDRFFEAAETAVSAAVEHGLTVHLYDEYPYPSGVAGGEVMLGNPQYMATSLVHDVFQSRGGRIRRRFPAGDVLCCQAYPQKPDGSTDWDSPVDLRSAIGMVLTTNLFYSNQGGLTSYNRKRYMAGDPLPTLDVDLPEGSWSIHAVIQVVVQKHKYWGFYADVMNPEVVARFIRLTHERYRKRLGEHFGTTILSVFVDETAPRWSVLIPERFQRKYGYDLLPLLPALKEESHPAHRSVGSDLEVLKLEMFVESFEIPVRDWCHENGLLYVGEKQSVNLNQLSYADIPGCDPGHTKAGAKPDLIAPGIRRSARSAASGAYFYAKQGALCECFHSLGWSATLQDLKVISEGLLLHGITHLVPHASFYTTHALAKHDAPASIFFQMPWWRHFSVLSEHLDRITERFEGTWIDADVFVLDIHEAVHVNENERREYGKLLDALMASRVQFQLIDVASLQSGRLDHGRWQIRQLTPRALIVPNMSAKPDGLFQAIRPLKAAGVEIVEQGRLPGAFGNVSEAPESVHLVRRTDGRRRLWFFLNTSNESCRFRVPEVLSPVKLGKAPLTRLSNGFLNLAPFESAMLTEGPPLEETVDGHSLRLRIPEAVDVQPQNSNLLRLDPWRVSLNGQSTVAPAMPIINHLETGCFSLKPKIRPWWGADTELALPPVKVEYACEFRSEYDGRIDLVMEPGSICGDWAVEINGEKVDGFRPSTHHVRGSLSADVTKLVGRGRNRVIVNVETDRVDGGLVNPLYLAGDFGVQLPASLVERRPTGRFEAWEDNLLPFFAGVVDHFFSFEIDELPDTERVYLHLEFPALFQGACQLRVNGSEWRPLLWSPYTASVRRNDLIKGRNRCELRVFTDLCRAFDGLRWNIAGHKYDDLVHTR